MAERTAMSIECYTGGALAVKALRENEVNYFHRVISQAQTNKQKNFHPEQLNRDSNNVLSYGESPGR